MEVGDPPRRWGLLNRCTTNSRLALVWFSMRKGLWMVSTCRLKRLGRAGLRSANKQCAGKALGRGCGEMLSGFL